MYKLYTLDSFRISAVLLWGYLRNIWGFPSLSYYSPSHGPLITAMLPTVTA
jgi:hypothetical protein